MKKKNLAAKIFVSLFFFTLVTGVLAISCGKMAYNRNPEFLRQVAMQIEKKINHGETKAFSETNEQDLKGIHLVNIRCASSDIEVESYDGNTLKILYEGQMRKDLREADLIDADNRDGEITLQMAKLDNNYVSLMWNGHSKRYFETDSQIRTKVMVPKNYTGDLSISHLNGDIDVDGIVVRTLRIKSDDGDIELNNLKGQSVEISSSSGDIHTENSQFNEWHLKSTDGDIHIAVPADMKYVFDVNTVNGDVKTDPDLISTKTTDEKKSSHMTIKLVNGDISISKYVDDGEDRE